MSFGDDEDILQDFLVEAGEILERLSQELVDLEQRPDDTKLLNAIFRGFHTVKGGAGFLALTPMVQCCHVTENLFDILRTGKRAVTPELMDVVLRSLDMVMQQFEIVNARGELPPVDPELIAALERLVSCEDLSEGAAQQASEEIGTEAADTGGEADQTQTETIAAAGEITDAEFEQFLDAISDGDAPTKPAAVAAPAKPAAAAPAAPASAAGAADEITEEEFEALLDQLHGKGKKPEKPPAAKPAVAAKPAAAPKATPAASSAPAPSGPADEISDDEFEALLDQLHGKGKGPKDAAVPTPAAPAAKAPAPKAAASTAPAPAPKAATPTTPAASAAKSVESKAEGGAKNADGELIDEAEFEALLDQLHGKGKAPTAETVAAAQTAPIVAAAKAGSLRQGSSMPTMPPASSGAANAAGDKDPGVETTVRVDTQRLDDIMNMVGELVLVRNRLVRLGNASANEALVKAVANLDVVTADLQTSVMKTRMQPIKKVFGRFPRVVRDLARSLKKEINLELVGEDTDLDKNLVEALADPLVHLVRNSVDHGIEFPDARAAAGKSRTGLVVLSAEQEGDHILLIISDDGAGMDPNKLRRVAVDKGLYDEDTAARLSDIEAFNLIFAPGFSTKKEISDVSGRGVGMDVVKTKISQLNGSVDIQSELGKGTKFIIKVPLTLAIMPTLMIMIGQQTFALPLVSVNEIFHMDLSKKHVVDGQDCITIRDQAVPLFYLKEWLIKPGTPVPRQPLAHVVIVTVGTRRVGFVVDQLIGQEEVVIKPLGKMLQGTPGMAGATITGDGTIALILDIPSLLRRYAKGNASWGRA